jgi:hypothetical protein
MSTGIPFTKTATSGESPRKSRPRNQRTLRTLPPLTPCVLFLSSDSTFLCARELLDRHPPHSLNVLAYCRTELRDNVCRVGIVGCDRLGAEMTNTIL